MNTIEITAADVRPNPATAENRPLADTELDAVNGGSLVLLGGAAAAAGIFAAGAAMGYGVCSFGRDNGWW